MRAAEAGGGGLAIDASPALQAIILHLRDEHAAAQPRLDEAAARLLRRGDRGVAATVVGFRASGALATGDLEQARALAEEAVAIAAPLGDYLRVGSTRAVLALVHGTAGDPEAGLAVMEPVLRLVESAGGDVFVPGMGRALGLLHLWRGDAGEAVRWLEPEARSTDRDAATYIAALALPPLGAALRRLGRDEEAAEALERGAEVARRLGMPGVLAAALDGQARLAGDPDAATGLHHEALALRAAHGLRPAALDSLDALAALAGPGDYAARVLAASDAGARGVGLPRRGATRRPRRGAARRARRRRLRRGLARRGGPGARRGDRLRPPLPRRARAGRRAAGQASPRPSSTSCASPPRATTTPRSAPGCS